MSVRAWRNEWNFETEREVWKSPHSHDCAAIISGKSRLMLSFFQKLSGGKSHLCLVALQFVLLLFMHNCTANMLSFKLKKEEER